MGGGCKAVTDRDSNIPSFCWKHAVLGLQPFLRSRHRTLPGIQHEICLPWVMYIVGRILVSVL